MGLTWSAPKAGDEVSIPGGPTRKWQEAKADKDGWLTHNALRGGYAYFAVPSDAERVMVLEEGFAWNGTYRSLRRDEIFHW